MLMTFSRWMRRLGDVPALLTVVLLALLLTPLCPATGRAQAPAPTTASAEEKLPTDPALVTGRLPNGLTYIIRTHKNPEGRVGIWLHVASGSLNETDATQGHAHFLEHLAFNGSANFPPGSVVPFFQSLGLSFGRDQNAFTGFDQTTYQLALPGGGRDVVEKGMLFMSDVAMRLSLTQALIDAERPVIVEEKRTRASARQRVEEQLYARLAPESTFGRRLPIGIEPTIKSVTQADFRDYYARWYVPSNMTVIVVGDTDPAMVVDVLTQQFGSGPTVPEPTPRAVGVQPTNGPRAIVVTDPELIRAEVSITRLGPPREATTTVAQRRRELVEMIGTWAFNRRLSAEIAAGRMSFLGAGASVEDWVGVYRMASLEASGKTGTWRAMLKELGTELQRARLHGFGEREIANARTMLIAAAEEGVRRESTRPARDVLRDLNRDVSRRRPPMSAAQTLALFQQLLPGITAREVSDAFADSFDPARALFIAELPAGDDVPSEADLVGLGRAAVDVKPDKPADLAPPSALLATLPRPGTVAESTTHAATAVTSLWLDNGVRVHHRRHAGRRRDRGDAGQPRHHRGGGARLGAARHTQAVEHGHPRSHDGRQGARGQRHGRRQRHAQHLRRHRRSGARAAARLRAADRAAHRAGGLRSVEGSRGPAAGRSQAPAHVGADRHGGRRPLSARRSAGQGAHARAARRAHPPRGTGLARAPHRAGADRGLGGRRHRPRRRHAPGQPVFRRAAGAPAHRRQDAVGPAQGRAPVRPRPGGGHGPGPHSARRR